MAGRQTTTHEWWSKRRRKFEIFISRLVWDEATHGDLGAVERRLKILNPLRWLQIKRETVHLAKSLVAQAAFPENAADDALHVALATTHGMHFLLTWNFTHIANAATESKIRKICENHGFDLPVICTPDQLMQI